MISPLMLSKNSIQIIENIIQNGQISQNEIAHQTNINRSIVSKEMAILETTQLITITNEGNRKLLSFNDNFAHTILIEIDRYFIHAFLNTALGYNIHSLSKRIDVYEVDDLFTNIEKIIDKLLNISHKPIIGIGFAVHGIVEMNHVISYAPNTKWSNLDLKSVIEKKYDIYTTVLNVANISAITEKVIAMPSTKSLVSVNIHSGVGAGFVMNDSLFVGSNGHSLEIGHINLLGHNYLCDCGANGCLETEISYPRLIDKMTRLGFENPTIEEFIKLYNNGNLQIIKLYNEYIELLAHGVRNLYLIIDPDILKINCEIFQSIPKSIEILKSKIHSSIINGTNISISRLNSSTRCLGLSTQITKGYLGLNSINLYQTRQRYINSYNQNTTN